VVHMDAKAPKPSMELYSRDELAPVFADLNQYDATMHSLGQTTILNANPRPRRGGISFNAPSPHDQGWKLAADDCSSPILRHTREDGRYWLFAERKLYVDSMEQRELS
jgi:hypothetical protein